MYSHFTLSKDYLYWLTVKGHFLLKRTWDELHKKPHTQSNHKTKKKKSKKREKTWYYDSQNQPILHSTVIWGNLDHLQHWLVFIWCCITLTLYHTMSSLRIRDVSANFWIHRALAKCWIQAGFLITVCWICSEFLNFHSTSFKSCAFLFNILICKCTKISEPFQNTVLCGFASYNIKMLV